METSFIFSCRHFVQPSSREIALELRFSVSLLVQMDRLTAMRVYSEVARLGSFTAASDALGMTRVAVTRHVEALEQWLGARLLHRSTRRLSMTASGESCLARCRQLLELSEAMKTDLDQQDAEPRGHLRVTCSMSFGVSQLAAAMSDFLAQFPLVSVDMLMVDRHLNLIEERIDLAVRIASELDPGLVARRLAPCHSVTCASPAYVERHGVPRSPHDLVEHNCLGYSHFGKGEWEFARGPEQLKVPVRGNLSADEATFLLQATLAGSGIAIQPTHLAGPLIDAGSLVQLLPDWQCREMSIWGIYASRRRPPPALPALLGFLAERFRDGALWERSTDWK
jgi:DNA-binding transcriptional LysR family regulator